MERSQRSLMEEAESRPLELHRMEQVRDNLVMALLDTFMDEKIDLVIHQQFVNAIHRIYPNLPKAALFESTRHLLGKTMTEHELYVFCWRIGANFRDILAGRPLGPLSYDATRNNFAAVHILSGSEGRRRNDIAGINFATVVISGWAATLAVQVFVPYRAMSSVAQKLGFSAPWGKFPHSNWRELVGLRAKVQLGWDKHENTITVKQIVDDQSVFNWNRTEFIKPRALPCLQDFTQPCHECGVGYDQCPRGTHPRTYEIGNCPSCLEVDVLFDPHQSSTKCKDCVRDENLSTNKKATP